MSVQTAYLGRHYNNIHHWIRNNYGPALICENDSSHTSKRYEWACIDGMYVKDISSFKQLCKKCHAQLDRAGSYQQRPLVQIDGKRMLTTKFASPKKAAEFVGVTTGSLVNCLNGRTKSCAGYKWQYLGGN